MMLLMLLLLLILEVMLYLLELKQVTLVAVACDGCVVIRRHDMNLMIMILMMCSFCDLLFLVMMMICSLTFSKSIQFFYYKDMNGEN